MVTDIFSDYKEEKECDFKDEHYSVRDNGAILRHPKNPDKPRQNDNVWMFGKPGDKGYLYISGVQAHRIVATAFHGVPQNSNMIVDHIDTNKQNNRPDNLRWITREENIINNPETLKKIMYRTGLSLDELKKDNWAALHKLNYKNQDTSWMHPTTKEEADNLRKHQLMWRNVENLRSPKGNMGEWVFKTEPRPTYIVSLTPNAGQREWNTPCEFPCCPSVIGNNPLEEYKSNMEIGKVFSKNKYISSILDVVDYSKNKKSLIVKTHSENNDGVKGLYLCQISFENGIFIHTNLGSFFTEEGHEKYFCQYTGKEWTGGDVLDDYC